MGVLSDGKFQCEKNPIPFCGLGVCQALVKENNELKITEDKLGIAKSPTTFRFLLISPDLQRLSNEAENSAMKDTN